MMLEEQAWCSAATVKVVLAHKQAPTTLLLVPKNALIMSPDVNGMRKRRYFVSAWLTRPIPRSGPGWALSLDEFQSRWY